MSAKTTMDQSLDKNMNKSLSSNSKSKFISENKFKYDNHEKFEETPTWAAVVTVLGYAILSALGWLRDFLRNIGLEEKKTIILLSTLNLMIMTCSCFYLNFDP
ncbi:unnamed protein product [Rotaria sp. Silwood2]|nr:unnamed protein product [Rotaria sp. Silwood2]